MSLNVLIVDDSRATRRFIGRVLEISGIDVAEYLQAGDGEEALDVLRGRPVDLVLTDINMPRMNGEQFLRAMRGIPEMAAIPVVIVSTDATDNRRARVFALGARGYITKPVTPEALRDELERVLSHHDDQAEAPVGMICPVRVGPAGAELVLHGVVSHTLETMCFTTVDAIVGCHWQPDPQEDRVALRLRFGGDAVGALSLSITRCEAARMAADFFGADDPDEVDLDQIESFVGELANVICGAILGWCKSDGQFELGIPEVCPETSCCAGDLAWSCSAVYSVGAGRMAVALRLGMVDMESFAVLHP